LPPSTSWYFLAQVPDHLLLVWVVAILTAPSKMSATLWSNTSIPMSSKGTGILSDRLLVIAGEVAFCVYVTCFVF
ncbi:hypothetical protein PM082_013549, partial [Marasmius tenuissimus]